MIKEVKQELGPKLRFHVSKAKKNTSTVRTCLGTMELFKYEFEYWHHFSFLKLGIGFEAETKVNKLN